jgi:hypothetical protein
MACRKPPCEGIAPLMKRHSKENEDQLLGTSTYRYPLAPATKVADAIE